MKKINGISIMTDSDYITQEYDWGKLTWFTSAQLGNSESLTTGRCEIKPGCQNPVHLHPNCSEVLHVTEGILLCRIEGTEPCILKSGDTISIAANIAHNLENTGKENAVMFICFSSADRKTLNAGNKL